MQRANARGGFLDHGAFKKLQTELSEYLRGPVTLAFHTGMRLGEIVGLKRNQVDLKARTIRLDAGETKNDEGRVIPMTTQVFEMLSVLPQDPERVFQNGKAPPAQFRKSWRAACVRAGLGKKELMPAGKTEVYSGLQFHDLRRSGVWNLIRAGASEQVAMKISGHKAANVFRRYNILTETDFAERCQDAGCVHRHAKNELKSIQTDVNLMESKSDAAVVAQA